MPNQSSSGASALKRFSFSNASFRSEGLMMTTSLPAEFFFWTPPVLLVTLSKRVQCEPKNT